MKRVLPILLLLLCPVLLWGQTTLAPGDVVFVAFNISDDRGLGPTNPISNLTVNITPGSIQDDQFQFMLLKPVAANTRIYFTDYGWKTSGGFQPSWVAGPANNGSGTGSADDGIISWATSTSLPAGTVVRITCKYNLSASIGTVTGEERITPFNTTPAGTGPYWLNMTESPDPAPGGTTSGDELFAYQATSARAANPTVLTGVRFIGLWGPTTGTEFHPAVSDVPASLTANGLNAAIEINHYQYPAAAKYDCATPGNISTGFPRALRNAIMTKAKWTVPNLGTACEGFFYNPATVFQCPQTSLAGFLPSTCAFTVLELTIARQPTSRTVCAGQTATFSVSATNATDYQWQSSPDGGMWTNLSNGSVYSGATSATLTVLNTTGLSGTFYRVIASETTEPASATSNGAARLTVDPVPTLTLAGTVVCGTSTVNLSATSGLSSYTFVGPGGVIGSGASNVTTATNVPTGAQSFTVMGVTSSGCPASATVTINTTTPVASIATSNNTTTYCQGGNFQLTASGGNTYRWTGPNNFSSAQANPILFNASLAAGGTYALTVTAANGCASSTTIAISINPAPATPLFANAGGTFCGGSRVELSVPQEAGITYQWFRAALANSDSFAAFNSGASVTVTQSSNYRYRATNPTTGCSALSDFDFVVIADLVFTGSIGQGDPQFNNRIESNGVVSTCATPKTCPGLSRNAPGPFRYDTYPLVNKRNVPVCVTVGLRSGCGNRIYNVAYSNSFDPQDLCTNYLGDPGGSLPWPGFFEITIPANGTAVLVVHEASNVGCSSYTLTADMPRDPSGITTLASSGTICGSTAATLVAPIADTYLWSGPLVAGVNSQSISSSLSTPTTYSVTLGYGNTGSCTATASRLVALTPSTGPVAGLTYLNGGRTVQVTGGSSYFMIQPIDRINGYQISETANNRDGLFTLKRPGPFWVIVTDTGGCSTRVDGSAP